ncbi:MULTISPECIES: hypothetical protein [unclassified Capnocytophaga]|jgi:hypothetical protein|uniref:DUF7935 family protein n=1 Tax=unclassified Capnocytophaga TaxID=2640652 RepID=UPI000202ECFF|nr:MULTISPECIES: hypothetical protein [unclassified Capnocytophaga]EGD34892.1 hypothetical protein HMPREF9071_0584 [Capnocytophaga sp. oral taxon 338 str. F0234]MEB3004623.1 hypothetical protein [Capnocytophaga sp. G2]
MFIQILSYCLPAVIVAVMAYFFFLLYFKNEDKKRRWHLIKDLQKEALPLRLQAYERLVLLLDRTSPQKLALRVAPASSDKQAYELLLIEHINAEYEHNITQQIFVSENLWNVILLSKNATLQIIHKIASDPAITDAIKLQEAIISEFVNKPTPSNNAISHLVNEVNNTIG